VNSNNDIALTSVYQGTPDFDPGPDAVSTPTVIDVIDAYLLNLSNNGDFKNVSTFNNANNGSIMIIEAIDNDLNNNSTYLAGGFYGTVDIDPSMTTTALNSVQANLGDAFVVKYNSSILSLSEIKDLLDITIYPNPTAAIINIVQKNHSNLKIDLINGNGIIIASQVSNKEKTIINLSEQASGAVYIKATNNYGSKITKVITGK